MTDQDRMEEVAEGELLTDLLQAADAPEAQPATDAEAAPSADSTDAEQASDAPADGNAPVAETATEDEAAAAPVAAAAEATAVATSEEAVAEATAVAASEEAVAEATAVAASDEGAEGTGASFTPVEEHDGRPRRLKDLEAGMELPGRVTSVALYGIFVDLGVGRDGLVHISEMSDTRIDSPSDLVQIGDTVMVRIKSLDPEARRISLTMRSKERSAESRKPKRAEINRDALTNLKPGDLVEGVITGMAPFGAFADIGVGKDGLIHVSELSETRVEKPEDAVKVGDRFTFKVLEADPEGTRISLSLRRAQRSSRMQQLEPGQIIEGTVSGIAPFGAFVDIGVGRDGLVHISALSENRVGKVEDVVKPGDKVSVRVLGIDQQSRRISLTMRLEEPAPSEETTSTEPAPSNVVPRTGPGAMQRFANVNTNRDERRRDDRGERGERDERRRDDRRGRGKPAQQAPESYTVGGDEPEEQFEGDATLQDLLSKFGGSNRRDRDDRRRDNDDDEDSEDRMARRQRDAIRRTLQQGDE
ncbi:MAG: S1 RNA-binding domain-containing protein [Chloroflexaceae bacterium]|nr:S1 RNA-binding domain-containing protein [Chloroflexaceae bacterium]